MEKIKSYVDRFLKTNKMKRSYELSSLEIISFMKETNGADTNKLFSMICTLFDYGYAKGYRAALAEMRMRGARA